ncbi:MAG TPA: YraN family protein [Verrucomicrobiae bacterium]|nr:YraN family protein [Verrucomicrobiae bacterium]
MGSNYAAGHNAEKRAAVYLESQGFAVLQLNWKTRYCEIDIVAKKDKVLYLVEVKYRRNTKHGGGLDYITPKKLHSMQFAAEMWVQNHDWPGDYQLAAVAIDANHIEFIDSIIT